MSFVPLVAVQGALFAAGRRTSSADDVSRLVGDGVPVCFEHRTLEGYDVPEGFAPYDLRLLSGGEHSAESAARQYAPALAPEVAARDRQMKAQEASAEAAGVDLGRYHLARLVPPNVLQRFVDTRGAAMAAMAPALAGDRARASYDLEIRPIAAALRKMELAGIRVDDALAAELLSREAEGSHAHRALRRMAGSGGWLQARFDPVGGKTGRVRSDRRGDPSAFDPMAIPHGPARLPVVSRHPRGSVATVDFNAIDMRSMVAACAVARVPYWEALVREYGATEDFHAKTAELVVGDARRRDVAKEFTYAHAYGGADETLASKCGISVSEVRQLAQKFDEALRPLSFLRATLVEEAEARGSVRLPGGRHLAVEPGSTPGKVLGTYAQGYSAWVFKRAVVAASRELLGASVVAVFTVHDELVLDAEEGSEGTLDAARRAMESAVCGTRFPAKLRQGSSYGVVAGGDLPRAVQTPDVL